MNFIDYIRLYNAQEGLEEKDIIVEDEIDYSEEIYLCELMQQYISMVKEKYERKEIARSNETFELTGMSEDDRFFFDSVAGAYIYANQYDRKEIEQEISELSGVTRTQIQKIAKLCIGKIKESSTEEKSKVAKMLISDEAEPNA